MYEIISDHELYILFKSASQPKQSNAVLFSITKNFLMNTASKKHNQCQSIKSEKQYFQEMEYVILSLKSSKMKKKLQSQFFQQNTTMLSLLQKIKEMQIQAAILSAIVILSLLTQTCQQPSCQNLSFQGKQKCTICYEKKPNNSLSLTSCCQGDDCAKQQFKLVQECYNLCCQNYYESSDNLDMSSFICAKNSQQIILSIVLPIVSVTLVVIGVVYCIIKLRQKRRQKQLQLRVTSDARQSRRIDQMHKQRRLSMLNQMKKAERVDGKLKLCIFCKKYNKNLSLTNCSHIFHLQCLKSQFLKKQSCPICSEDIYPVQQFCLGCQNKSIMIRQNIEEVERNYLCRTCLIYSCSQ